MNDFRETTLSGIIDPLKAEQAQQFFSKALNSLARNASAVSQHQANGYHIVKRLPSFRQSGQHESDTKRNQPGN